MILLPLITLILHLHYASSLPNDPRSIRLQSVMGLEDAMDVRLTSPLLNVLKYPWSSTPQLYPTLWNVSYGFRLHASQTSVHRIGLTQRTNAVLYRKTIESNVLPKLSKIQSEPNSLSADNFVQAIEDATFIPTSKRTTCSPDWNCPSAVGTPCRVELDQPIVHAAARHTSTTDYDTVSKFVSYFSTGNPNGNRSSTQDWEIKYSATMSNGLVFRLNDQIIQENAGPISSKSPIVLNSDTFNVLNGWNKLEIFGSDRCTYKKKKKLIEVSVFFDTTTFSL